MPGGPVERLLMVAPHPVRPRSGPQEGPFVHGETLGFAGDQKLFVVGVLLQQGDDPRALVVCEVPPGQPGGDQVALVVPGEGRSGGDKNEDARQHMPHSTPHEPGEFTRCTAPRARRAAAAVLLALAVGLSSFIAWQRWF
jgi:hypothetical protein